MAKFQHVSEAVFEVFRTGYPRNLTPDYTAICEPPMQGFYDFDAASGGDALVAAYHDEYGVGPVNFRISTHLLTDADVRGFEEACAVMVKQ
jgi:hypothetical protein